MKKLIVCVLTLSLLLCGCAGKPEADPERFEVPGLKWGMSPGEVLSALEKTEADIVHENEDHNEDLDVDYWNYVMILHGVEVFGQETTAAVYFFTDYTQTGESYLLSQIKLCYPDGYDGSEKADAAALEAELKRIYGEPNESQHWDWQTRKDMEITQERPANLFEWESTVTGWDCLSEQQQKGVCDDYEATRAEGSFSLERYLEYWKVPAFRMTFQPYWHRVMALGDHPLTEENRSLGLTNICIAMDAGSFFGFPHSAEVILGTE